MSKLELPTDNQRRDWQLRTCHKLKDHEIAELVGVRRETVNRRIAEFHRRVRAIQQVYPELKIKDIADGRARL